MAEPTVVESAPTVAPATPAPAARPAAKPAAPAPAPYTPPAPPAPPAANLPAEKPAEIPAPPKAAAPAAPAPAPAAKPAIQSKPAEPKDTPKKVTSLGGQMRIWTDNTGTYQVEARLVGTLDRGAVARLQRADGSFVRVEITRLSENDQQFLMDAYRVVASN